MDIRIDGIEPFAEGRSFGKVGSYERLKGVARGQLDPLAPQNSGIVDLTKAPRNARGLVDYEVDLDIQMRLDGTLASEPVTVAVRGPSRSIATAVADSAKRAIVQCQAYAFLPKPQYESWKVIQLTFGLKDMM